MQLGTVRAAGNGLIEVYDFTHGNIGRLFSEQAVRAGANSNFHVNIQQTDQDAVALLKVGGHVVDRHRLGINNSG